MKQNTVMGNEKTEEGSRHPEHNLIFQQSASNRNPKQA